MLRSGLPSWTPERRRAEANEATRLGSRPSPEQVAEVLRGKPGFAWLDGAGTRHFLFHRPLAVISCTGDTGSISGPEGTIRFPARGIELLDAMLEAWGGSSALLAGFLSYDLASEIEDLGAAPPGDFNFPSLHFGLYDSALVYENRVWHVQGNNDQAEELLRRAEAIVVPAATTGPLSPGPLESRPGKDCFEGGVERIVRRIHNGDFFQTNLCRRLEVPLEASNAWELYRRMRTISPAQYGAFLDMGDEQALLSVSPELFLKVDAAGGVESRPIKGTRPRARDPRDDQAQAAELLGSEKDRAELAMIVDVVRNDLSRVCETGSVRVARHAELETLPTVHHTVSTVQGRLKPGTNAAALLCATFPAASITGAPKIEAMRAAMSEEARLRGPCMGAIGWISLDGRLELSVAIRTAFLTGGRVLYYAGGGITADSNPALEFEETVHKTQAFVRALALE